MTSVDIVDDDSCWENDILKTEPSCVQRANQAPERIRAKQLDGCAQFYDIDGQKLLNKVNGVARPSTCDCFLPAEYYENENFLVTDFGENLNINVAQTATQSWSRDCVCPYISQSSWQRTLYYNGATASSATSADKKQLPRKPCPDVVAQNCTQNDVVNHIGNSFEDSEINLSTQCAIQQSIGGPTNTSSNTTDNVRTKKASGEIVQSPIDNVIQPTSITSVIFKGLGLLIILVTLVWAFL